MNESNDKVEKKICDDEPVKSLQEIRRQRSLHIEKESIPLLKELSERYPIMDINDLVHKLFKIGLLTVARYGLEESINQITKPHDKT